MEQQHNPPQTLLVATSDVPNGLATDIDQTGPSEKDITPPDHHRDLIPPKLYVDSFPNYDKIDSIMTNNPSLPTEQQSNLHRMFDAVNDFARHNSVDLCVHWLERMAAILREEQYDAQCRRIDLAKARPASPALH